VRAICNFLQICPNVIILELLDNGITELGCQFLKNIVAPESKANLMHLKLDHNTFGAEGLRHLADGLARNSYITLISLNYCNIDETGARSCFEILINSKSLLEDFSLNGNHLGNKGVIEVLRGTSVAKNLKKIYLSDN
jgi:Ran GTPase-activating protein (RanGAP) involved in mRNA processing and transport